MGTRIQDIQADVALGKKLAEYAETVLAQDAKYKELAAEAEALKNSNTALTGLLKEAQERSRTLEQDKAALKQELAALKMIDDKPIDGSKIAAAHTRPEPAPEAGQQPDHTVSQVPSGPCVP